MISINRNMCCARASRQPIKTLFLPQIYSRIIQSPNSSAANLNYTRTLDPHLVHSVIALDYLSHTRASANANPYRMADEANNPSVIVYEPATQTMSIAKIRDLGKSFDISFYILLLSCNELTKNFQNRAQSSSNKHPDSKTM